MRSLLILEVQHGEDTDRLSSMIDHILHEYNEMMGHHYPGRPVVTDYTLRVDVPECFVLDSDDMAADIAAGRVCGDHERPTPCTECL